MAIGALQGVEQRVDGVDVQVPCSHAQRKVAVDERRAEHRLWVVTCTAAATVRDACLHNGCQHCAPPPGPKNTRAPGVGWKTCRHVHACMSHRRHVLSVEHDVKRASCGAAPPLPSESLPFSGSAAPETPPFSGALPLSEKPGAYAARCRMSPWWATRVLRQQRASRSHTRTVPSRPPDSRSSPAKKGPFVGLEPGNKGHFQRRSAAEGVQVPHSDGAVAAARQHELPCKKGPFVRLGPSQTKTNPQSAWNRGAHRRSAAQRSALQRGHRGGVNRTLLFCVKRRTPAMSSAKIGPRWPCSAVTTAAATEHYCFVSSGAHQQ